MSEDFTITIVVPRSALIEAADKAVRAVLGPGSYNSRTDTEVAIQDRVRRAVLAMIGGGELDAMVAQAVKQRAAGVVAETVEEEIAKATRKRVKNGLPFDGPAS